MEQNGNYAWYCSSLVTELCNTCIPDVVSHQVIGIAMQILITLMSVGQLNKWSQPAAQVSVTKLACITIHYTKTVPVYNKYTVQIKQQTRVCHNFCLIELIAGTRYQ